MTRPVRSPLIPIRPELTPELLAWAQRAESVLDRELPPANQMPERLHQAMRYSVLGGGKRLRALLAYAAGRCFAAPPECADASAAALEIIHAYSLIHDDLPAMDNDDLRRGKPTCHIAFGEAMAILAGDALQALAFEVLTSDTQSRADAGTRIKMLRTLAQACGAHGMAGGQAFDLDAVGQRLSHSELERMHAYKTGALIRAAVLLGTLGAGRVDATELDRMGAVGARIGLAFQIRDDILDIEGDTEVIGKRQGADIARDKPTYPSIIGMEASRALAQSLRDETISLLAGHGTAAESLRDLAHYAVDRRS
jgi:geranylgeranyl pyrophosphate synthase